MVNVLRRFSQPIMLVVTVLVIVSFTWFYQGSVFANRKAGSVMEIYGDQISRDQYERLSRRMDIFEKLGMGYAESLDPRRNFMSRQQPEPNDEPVINSIVFEREAKALGLGATPEQIQKMILDKFKDPQGNFDADIFEKFVERILIPSGYTKGSLEDFASSAVKLEKMKNILGSTTAPSTAEVRGIYEEFFHPIRASYVKFKLEEHLKGVQVTEEELKARYEERKERLLTDEKRKVRMVSFKIPELDKELDDKIRTEMLQPMVNQAEKFVKAAQATSFDEAAKQMNVPIVEVEDFSSRQPPPALSEIPEAVEQAFELTMEAPISGEIVSKKAATVIQLAGITAPQPKTFEETRAQLETELKDEKARKLMTEKITPIRAKIEAEVAAGKNFTDAAKAAGVEAKAFPEFSRQEAPKEMVEDSNQIKGVAEELPAGKVSEVTRVKDGALLVFAEERPPVDDAKFEEKKTELMEGILNNRKDILFRQWLKTRREQAGIVTGRSNG